MPTRFVRSRFSLSWLGRRLQWELYRRIHLRRSIRTVFDGDLQVDLSLEHITDRFLFVEGHLELLVHELITSLIRPGMTVLDIGANMGVFTLLMAKRVGPKGRVIAFEPNRAELSRLERHVTLNGFDDRVRVEGCCVFDRTGEVTFDPKDAAHSPHGHIDPQGISGITVPCVRLDDYVELHALTKIDFVKVDTQGAERLILRGAQRLLSQGTAQFWLCEVDDQEYARFGFCGAEIIMAFAAHGYRAYEPGLGPVLIPHITRRSYSPGYMDLLFVAPGSESAIESCLG